MSLVQPLTEDLKEERKAQAQKQATFLQQDYELKITYLTNHLARLWSRFNYFVWIEAALIGGKFLTPTGMPSWELAVAGLLMSLVWYVMGAHDRYLVRLHRHQVAKAAQALAQTLWAEGTLWQTYRYAGQVDAEAIADLREAERKKHQGQPIPVWHQALEGLSGWRVEPLSPSHLAALFPLLLCLLWGVILVATLLHLQTP